MSRQVRNRVTATVLGGFLLGAALLTTGTANADQVTGGSRQVVFAGGGVLGLPCDSTPSVESMTVPADGRVRLVNRTGHGARLRLDGEAVRSIPDDGSTEVVFRRGTTAVTLEPSCTFTDQADPVLVTASPTSAIGPDPIPTPADQDLDPAATSDPPTGPASGTPMDSGAVLPDSVPPATRPQRPSTTTAGRPTTARPNTPHVSRAAAPAATKAARASTTAAQASTTAAQAMPRGGPGPRIKTRIPVRGTAAAAVPSFSGMPPGDDKTVLRGVPAVELPAPPEMAAPEQPAGPSAGLIAAGPVAAMRPLPDAQPIGLLAAIATVSVLGVAIGVIRSIVSERAYRANVA